MTRRTQQERKADTRIRLLDAAASLFAEHGIDAVSVDAVAEAAGRTSGAVYSHFGSKQGLLLAMLDEGKNSLVAQIAAEFEMATDVLGRLRAVASSVIVKPSLETQQLLLLERELWLRAARDPEVAAVLGRRWAEAHDQMTSGFASWSAAGLVPPTNDPALMAASFRAVVVGLEMQQRLEPVLDVDTATAALASVIGIRQRQPAAAGRA